ncbi:MAG: nodulation protein NfeD [Tindallia sp. MSAO_Bac2]|nr:MAG: nodulation protein NfeD [Tindallia sp. MSAO_Bac2]
MKADGRTKLIFAIGMIFAVLLSSLMVMADENDTSTVVYTVNVEGMVTAGTTNHIRRAIDMAENDGAEALVILLNTPGGLVNATLDIIGDMISADVPVITYVYPQGGIAASAGTFIMLGGHKAAMAPGTTIGAAMPVQIRPDEEGSTAADDKTILFLAGHMKSIAEARNRPGDVAEKFVTENLTLSGREALESGIIDRIENNLTDLLAGFHGESIDLESGRTTLNTKNAAIYPLEKTTQERITHLVSNPQITFVLLLVGVYGLIIGFSSPGTFVPEVLGAISLILALYGLGLFEVNFFAALLMILGVGLLVAEALTPTYGVLGVGGVISMVLGIIYLPVEPLVSERWLSQFRFMAFGIGIIGSVVLVIMLAGIYRLRKSPVVHGNNEFVTDMATVVETIDPEGLIMVRGELWKARSVSNERIDQGEKVKIVDRENMTCIVKAEEEK